MCNQTKAMVSMGSKRGAIVALLLVSLTGSLCVDLPHGFKQVSSLFSNQQLYQNGEDVVVVQEPLAPEHFDINEMSSFLEKGSLRKSLSLVGHDYFDLIPVDKGAIKIDETTTWEAPCFGKASATASEKDGTVTVTMNLSEPTSLTCRDTYLLATVRSFHLPTYYFRGKHTVHWKGLSDLELSDIKENGIRILLLPLHAAGTVVNAIKTVQLFLGGLSTKHAGIRDSMAKKNIDFLKSKASVEMKPRKDGILDIDESLIQSGDFFGIIRLDGLDTMLAWAMGSRTGHTVVAMRMDGELQICESQDGWYWPRHGIQCNPYKQWLEWAHKADFNVVWLPLTEEARSKFNQEAAEKFVKESLGLPYGYNNMLFSWIDTPENNYPGALDSQTLMTLMSIADRISPSTIDLIFNEALNMRLGTSGLRTAEIYAEASKRGLSFTDLVTMPEQDKWVYKTGKQMVCCVFVMSVLQAGGLFDDIADIQATEFTNWDVYSLNVYQAAPNRPQACVDADPTNKHCQIMGKYELHLEGAGTVQAYPHMRQKCSSMAPDYHREEGC